MRAMRVIVCALAISTGAAADAPAQAPAAPAPLTIGNVTVSGSVRTRVEAWRWFDESARGAYVFPAALGRLSFRESRKRIDWQVELAAPLLLGLPSEATVPGAQGQLGLGAAYYAANDNNRNAAQLFAKQAFARFKWKAGAVSQALTGGRMEFVDGTEANPANAVLAALKRDRIAHRLLGTFGFTHVGRSMDGVLYSAGSPRTNVTGFVARPTQGVFQVNGWGELKIDVFHGALTRQVPGTRRSGEWRVFALGYRDSRDNVIKTDNRASGARQADRDHIGVVTFGGHYLGTASTAAGPIDLLAWGALQRGSWGTLSQRAGAVALEAGWQPSGLSRVKPWIRGGWNYGSGDGDPNDATHGTFFQVLPTPRVYARFPFFNMMNTSDVFGEVLLRPSPTISARADVHRLRLSDKADLWYQGGGAFQPETFGYAGRPSNGATGLATLYDGSIDWTIGPHLLSAYYGIASGGPVIRGTYPAGGTGQLGYVELTVRF